MTSFGHALFDEEAGPLDRFWFLWDEPARGALGVVVIADTRRLQNSFAAIDYFERHGLSIAVAVNPAPGREVTGCTKPGSATAVDSDDEHRPSPGNRQTSVAPADVGCIVASGVESVILHNGD